MDVSDRQASESAMIAFLPTNAEWCKTDLPHMTLVYAGLVSDLKPTAFNDLAKDAAMLASIGHGFSLPVLSRETFGESRDVDVFRLQPSPELWAMRRVVEKWNASQFPFNPHVTIGPVGTPVEEVPRYIRFNRLFVGFGDENLTFKLSYD